MEEIAVIGSSCGSWTWRTPRASSATRNTRLYLVLWVVTTNAVWKPDQESHRGDLRVRCNHQLFVWTDSGQGKRYLHSCKCHRYSISKSVWFLPSKSSTRLWKLCITRVVVAWLSILWQIALLWLERGVEQLGVWDSNDWKYMSRSYCWCSFSMTKIQQSIKRRVQINRCIVFHR